MQPLDLSANAPAAVYPRRVPSPEELNLPHPDWRDAQWEALSYLLNAPPDRWVLISAPTGSGKSALALGLARATETRAIIATTTTELQSQYHRLYGVPKVWGKERYPCTRTTWRELYQTLFGMQTNEHGIEEPSAAEGECTIQRGLSCRCAYYADLAQAMSETAVFNLHHLFFSSYHESFHPARLLVLDEAHLLEATLQSLSSLEWTDGVGKRYGWGPFPDLGGSSAQAARALSTWLSQAEAREAAYLRTLRVSRSEEEFRLLQVRRARFWKRIHSLRDALTVATDGQFFIQSSPSRLKVEPVSPFRALKSLLDRTLLPGGRLVLMSATVGEPYAFLESLGLDPRRFWYIESAPSIPADRRPVYIAQGAPRLNHRSGPGEWLRVGQLIVQAMRRHPHDRGIVHVHNWSEARMVADIVAALDPEQGARIMLPSGDRSTAVQAFLNTPRAVAVSPSWRSGLDLPDDKARFCIIAKIPFPDLGNPVVYLRFQAPGGKRWYRWRAASEVVQAAGRIVRHELDYGTTYILDANWNQVRSFVPPWFQPIPISLDGMEVKP